MTKKRLNWKFEFRHLLLAAAIDDLYRDCFGCVDALSPREVAVPIGQLVMAVGLRQFNAVPCSIMFTGPRRYWLVCWV